MRYIDTDKFAKQVYEVAYPIVHGTNSHERGLTLMGIAQLLDEQPTADVRKNVKAEWEFTDHAYTVYCKRCRYKHNRASQYCPECGAYMTNGTKWFGTDAER